jgi:hypothetical protein
MENSVEVFGSFIKVINVEVVNPHLDVVVGNVDRRSSVEVVDVSRFHAVFFEKGECFVEYFVRRK